MKRYLTYNQMLYQSHNTGNVAKPTYRRPFNPRTSMAIQSTRQNYSGLFSVWFFYIKRCLNTRQQYVFIIVLEVCIRTTYCIFNKSYNNTCCLQPLNNIGQGLKFKTNEPTHEILALFDLRKFILQIRMRGHPKGLDV